MRRARRAGLVALLLGLGALAAGARAAEPVRLTFAPPVEAGTPPPGWEALTFPRVARHSRYTVVREGQDFVLRAESEAAASALYRPLDLDPKVHRVLSWRWKVEGVLDRSDPRRKAGDDYAARVYVAFGYDPAGASAWERAPLRRAAALLRPLPARDGAELRVGEPAAGGHRARQRLLRARQDGGGPERRRGRGAVVTERHDIYADYRRIVGGEPPRIVGVALMTDTDDTGERAVAYYGAIRLEPGADE
jgi:hypothetical protein